MAKLVSKVYGEALFEAAMENKQEAQLMEEIRTVCGILDENPGFEKLMTHPGIPKQEKVAVIRQVFDGRASKELTGFLTIVVEKERYQDLRAIFSYFTDKVKAEQGIGVAYVTSAAELSGAQRESVKEKLLATTGYRTMEMHFQTDASLIGGMVIRINDRVVDGSIRRKLDDLTRQLLQIRLG